MALEPNVAVGALGAAIVLVIGGILVANWETLADIQSFEVVVVAHEDGTDVAGRAPADGSTQEQPVQVAEPNVTRMHGQLFWNDQTPSDAPARVTLTIYRPGEAEPAYEASSTSGVRGLGFDIVLGATPPPRSYEETPDTAETKFARDYVASDAGTGTWRFVLKAEYTGQSPLGPGDVRWNLMATWESWEAFIEPGREVDFTEK